MVKVIQINLHHSKAASAALLLRLAERGEDVALIQEPWTHNGKILGLGAKGYKLLYANCTGNLRSCILAKNHLNIFILTDYSDADTVTTACETGETVVWLTSCYMAHDHVDPPPHKLVHDMVNAAKNQQTPIIIGADANAHHHIWGSSDTNTRGECILDFLLCNNLVVVNKGTEPTFVVANRKEVLDITIISATHQQLIENWRVSNDCSLSDHRYFEFSFQGINILAKPFLNRRKTR